MDDMGKKLTEKQKKGLGKLDNMLDPRLETALNSCVHCGLCGTSCQYFLALGDARFIPAHKVDLVAGIYRRYHTTVGKVAPKLTGARDFNDETIDEMVDTLFGACTMCGRCIAHCSIGVDIPHVVLAGRKMLSEMDMVPKSLMSTVNAALETGNNMAIPTEEFVDTLSWLEEDLQMDLDDDNAKIPVNEPGKKILYTLNPREPKFFPLSISAMAKVFHKAGESWTLSTEMYDVTNYAYYSGNDEHAAIITQRLVDVAVKLGVDTVVLAECGHGSRSHRWEGPNWIKEEYPFRIITTVELLAEYIRDGKIKVDPEKNTMPLTLHDPCNLVRTGGIVDEQRYVLSKTTTNFREMNPYGRESFCCGGGGGNLAMSEYNERRLAIGKLKADQIKATETEVVVTPCHNCVDQLMGLNQEFKMGVEIRTLGEIVADAIVD